MPSRDKGGSIIHTTPGPLTRAQYALWRRSTERARVLGNLISEARYWMWRLSR